MIKCKVWTKPDYDLDFDARAKCVFNGEIAVIPTKDVGIVVRSGFCVETITCIYYDLVDGDVEIHIASPDRDNAYGPCLMYPNRKLLPNLED